MADENKKTLAELTDLLKQCNIDDYILNTHNKELTIYYRHDFNNFFPNLNGKPMVGKNHYTGETDLPEFYYKSWTIRGSYIDKPKK